MSVRHSEIRWKNDLPATIWHKRKRKSAAARRCNVCAAALSSIVNFAVV